MSRLFLTLYFVVAIAILLIGYSTEWLWRSTQETNDNDIQELAQLAMVVAMHANSPKDIEQSKLATGLPINIMSINAIAFLPEQQRQLRNQKAVITYDQQDNLFIYAINAESNQLVQIGPVSTQIEQQVKNVYLIASYLFLGGVILLWSWPLWRDLLKLSAQAKRLGEGKFDRQPDVSPHSVVYPVSQAFSQMSTRIARMIEEQKLMFNAVSHDIRTPLSRLKFTAEMLDESQQHIKKGMNQDISEIESLLEDILGYGRLEANQQTLDLVEVDFHQLLTNLVARTNFNNTLNITLSVDANTVAFCDGHLIERALQNIVVNAVRYHQQHIDISCSLNKGKIMIHVDDDGEGIAPKNWEKVFQPFQRLDTSRNKEKGGFGLGLAIVKRIIELHQGSIDVSQAPIGGARFTITLPMRIKSS
ncbi:ATP-binding protein [Thalassotalea euphylliae]|uniref:ATP-binding protein n=1 Tax=Thalassotalea euphylliae TaxID=1655234 RepID=UPI003638DF15